MKITSIVLVAVAVLFCAVSVDAATYELTPDQLVLENPSTDFVLEPMEEEPYEGNGLLESSVTFPNIAPALQGGITAHGLKTIIDQVLPRVIAQIQGMVLPNQSGNSGLFSWGVSNIKVQNLGMTGTTTSIQNGLGASIQGLSVRVTLNWNFGLRIFPWLPRGSGGATVTISSSNLGAVFAVGVQETPTGLKPLIKASSVTVNLTNVNISINGSIFSWFYNIIIGLFQGSIRNAIAASVRTSFISAVDLASATVLRTMDTLSPVDRWGMIDLSLTNGANYVNQEIVLAFNGEVYPSNTKASDGAVPRKAVPFTPSGRMMDLYMSDFVLNSGCHSWIKMGGLNVVLNSATPNVNKLPVALQTNAWAAAAPALAKAYVNLPMEIQITTAGMPEPRINALEGQLALSSSVQVIVNVITGDKKVEAFAAQIDAGAALTLRVDNRGGRGFFVPQIPSVKVSGSILRSSVGKLDIAGLLHIVDAALNIFAVPSVNQQLLNGFPLPGVAGLSFVGTSFTIKPNYIAFASDLAYVPTLQTKAILSTISVNPHTLEASHSVDLESVPEIPGLF